MFQWNVASVLTDPIITPFFSYANLTVGMLFVTIVFVFPIFFNNVWNTSYFNPNSSSVFDNTGSKYSTFGLVSLCSDTADAKSGLR